MDVYRTVLLIEDDPDDQLMFLEIIAELSESITCFVADNGMEGLAMIQRGIQPDIIFADINMPFLNGKEFLRNYTAEAATPSPVIMMSTSQSQKDILEVTSLGASYFFTKPYNLNDLRRLLSHILNGGWR